MKLSKNLVNMADELLQLKTRALSTSSVVYADHALRVDFKSTLVGEILKCQFVVSNLNRNRDISMLDLKINNRD